MDPSINPLQAPDDEHDGKNPFFLANWSEIANSNSSKVTKKRKLKTIDVHGGCIVQSTCRKDRHSKVCTSKGLKDRRVRLSPGTAILFYDVQDRLGYDRPSKAIDWLIKEAKAAIDALDVAEDHAPSNGKTQLIEQGNDDDSAELTRNQDQHVNADYPISNFSVFDNREEDSLIYPNYQQIFDSNLENGKLQRIFTNAGTEYSFINSLPLQYQWPLPGLGQNQIVSQRESLQSSFISHSRINTEFQGINFYSEDFSKFTAAAATAEEDDKDKFLVSSKQKN